MTASLPDVIKELTALGLDAEVFHSRTEGASDGINVWVDPGSRYPDCTVWPPARGYGWIWGAHHQWGCPEDYDAQQVAYRVSATLPR